MPYDQLSRVAKYGPLSTDEIAALRRMGGVPRHYARGGHLRHRGDEDPEVYILQAGWLACSVAFEDGRRQIVKIHLPGDFVGMPSFAAPRAAETIHALSDATVAPVPRTAFGTIFREQPRLAAILFVACQEERVTLLQRLAWASRTRANRRVAELVLSLHDRMSLLRPAHEGPLFAPMNQEEIADATGLTAVTVNHCLSELRRRRIATWKRLHLEVHDRPMLEELAGLPAEPRRDLSWFGPFRESPEPALPA